MISFPWHIHVLYWLAIVVIWVIFAVLVMGEFYDPFINKLGYLSSQLIFSYCFFYVLLQKLFQKKYLQFSIGLVLLTYITTVLARFMKIYFTETLTGFESDKESIPQILMDLGPLLIQYMIWVLMTPVLTVIIIMILNHYYQRERLAQLHNKKSQTELRFLKTQLHPHFLFNTLNNLYTLSLTNAQKTTDVAQRLYDILDFMFHRRGQTLVKLKEEVALLKNYIELEKLRYGDRLHVDLIINVDDDQKMIIPLLLLSVVENAFKHGASGDLDAPRIDMHLYESNGILKFKVENTKPINSSKDQGGYKKGIGVKNIKRQLELIYADAYSYEVTDAEDKYCVDISVNLSLTSINENELEPLMNSLILEG